MVDTVFKVLQAIAMAVSTLVGTVFKGLQAIAKVVSILCRLKEALDDERERESSCRQRDGLVLQVRSLPTTCLVYMGAATGAAMDQPRANKPKQVKAGNAPQKDAAKSNMKNGGSNKINQLAARDHNRTNKPAKQVNAANAPQKYAAKNNNNNGGQNKRTKNATAASAAATSLTRRNPHPAP